MTTTAYQDFTKQLQQVYEDRIREQTINGVDYVIQAQDPYGAWVVIEPTNPYFDDHNFTTQDAAWNFIKGYEGKKSLEVKPEKVLKKGK